MKGKPDLRVPSQQGRKNQDKMKWGSSQFCEKCFKKPCKCEVKNDQSRLA